MAAFSTENANRVWQRVAQTMQGANEASKRILRELKAYLATQKNVQSLQFCSINGNTSASDGGNTANNILGTGAINLYALWLKKTSATACWFKGSDNATTAATDGTQVIAETSATDKEEIVRVWPNGKALANGLTVTMDTTATGSTLTLNANRFDGFAIVG